MGAFVAELPCPNSMVIKSGPCLSQPQKLNLIQDVTDLKILHALKNMPVDKAPGIDVSTMEFYTSQWNTVINNMRKAIKEFLFKSGKLLKSFNCTAVTLVPKCANPTMVKDFSLIAYCNTFYKILTKILTNRIKKVIGNIICPSQYSFID